MNECFLYRSGKYGFVMDPIWQVMNNRGSNWKQLFKASLLATVTRITIIYLLLSVV
jgi:hypothetical protein